MHASQTRNRTAMLTCKARHSANGEIAMLTDADIQLHAERIRDDGYTVIERAASPDLVEGLKDARC
ncbi:putative RNA polymerase sigma factor [Bradyrhizobium sp. JR3.5]